MPATGMTTGMRDIGCSLSTRRYLPTLFKWHTYDYEISPRRTWRHLQEFHHFMYIMFDHVHSFSIYTIMNVSLTLSKNNNAYQFLHFSTLMLLWAHPGPHNLKGTNQLDNWEVGDTLIHLDYGKAQHSLDRKQFSECQSPWMSDCRGAYMQKSRKGDLRITSPISC